MQAKLMRNDPALPPPPHLLEALRQPCRPQLHDECVKEMFRRWKRLGKAINADELNELLDLVAVDMFDVDRVCQRRPRQHRHRPPR
jgi:hypothetical protein